MERPTLGKDVLLLHGLSKDCEIMQDMADFLSNRDYHCHNISYDSLTLTIQDCVRSVAKQFKQSRTGREQYPVHVIAHSLGGLIACVLITELCPEINWGRVVFLGTPFKGSKLAKKLSQFSFYRRTYGPAGVELGDSNRRFTALDKEYGVIAGTKSTFLDRVFAVWLGWSEHDGKVRIAETKIPGMKDFLLLPAVHAKLPKTPGVILQTHSFLEKGFFRKP